MEPVAGKFSTYKMPPVALGNYREFLTSVLLSSMTLRDIEFDPVITVNGEELIIPEGAIFVSGHFYLNFIFLRRLYDIGREPSLFLRLGPDEWRIPGTKAPFNILKSTPVSLNKVKRLVSEGKIVVAAIDSRVQYLHWKKLNISDADIFVNDSLIKLAEQTKTPIFFFDTYFDENDNVASIIERASSNDASIVLAEFAEFISSALKRRKNLSGE